MKSILGYCVLLEIAERVHVTVHMINCVIDKILNTIEVEKITTTALKNILKLANL